jgi:hypothetical protein
MKETLKLRNSDGVWVFDDPMRGVWDEPFVEGSSEIIFEICSLLGLHKNEIQMTFSDEYFPDQHIQLQWIAERSSGTWNLYSSDTLGMEGWLCPVLLQYFTYPPKFLYVKVSG